MRRPRKVKIFLAIGEGLFEICQVANIKTVMKLARKYSKYQVPQQFCRNAATSEQGMAG